MKTLAITLLMSICFGINGFSQNRIKSWDKEKITSIRIECKTTGDQTDIKQLTDKSKIEKVLSFLCNVEFSDLNGKKIPERINSNDWKYKIVFQNQRDQVYLFKGFAFIGKTTFIIDNSVVQNFSKLIEE